MHAGAHALYGELAGTMAIYAFDPYVDKQGSPRQVAVATNMELSYHTAVQEATPLFIDAHVIKISRQSAICRENLINAKTN